MELTANGGYRATPSEVINDGGIAFNDAINAEVTTVARIRNLPIF
jgi:hypothetical protein